MMKTKMLVLFLTFFLSVFAMEEQQRPSIKTHGDIASPKVINILKMYFQPEKAEKDKPSLWVDLPRELRFGIIKDIVRDGKDPITGRELSRAERLNIAFEFIARNINAEEFLDIILKNDELALGGRFSPLEFAVKNNYLQLLPLLQPRDRTTFYQVRDAIIRAATTGSDFQEVERLLNTLNADVLAILPNELSIFLQWVQLTNYNRDAIKLLFHRLRRQGKLKKILESPEKLLILSPLLSLMSPEIVKQLIQAGISPQQIARNSFLHLSDEGTVREDNRELVFIDSLLELGFNLNDILKMIISKGSGELWLYLVSKGLNPTIALERYLGFAYDDGEFVGYIGPDLPEPNLEAIKRLVDAGGRIREGIQRYISVRVIPPSILDYLLKKGLILIENIDAYIAEEDPAQFLVKAKWLIQHGMPVENILERYLHQREKNIEKIKDILALAPQEAHKLLRVILLSDLEREIKKELINHLINTYHVQLTVNLLAEFLTDRLFDENVLEYLLTFRPTIFPVDILAAALIDPSVMNLLISHADDSLRRQLEGKDVKTIISELMPLLKSNEKNLLLSMATGKGNKLLVESALKHGADPNFQEAYEEPVIYMAMRNLYDYDEPKIDSKTAFEIIELLLKYGVEINKIYDDVGSDEEDTILATAIGEPSYPSLITDKEIRNRLVRLLLRYDADPSLKRREGKTAIDYARKAGDQELVNMLEAAAQGKPIPTEQDIQRKRQLEALARRGLMPSGTQEPEEESDDEAERRRIGKQEEDE